MQVDHFVAFDDSFSRVVGSSPRLVMVAACDAHEGPAYVPDLDAVFFTSLSKPGTPAQIKSISLGSDAPNVSVRSLDAAVTMPNGMTVDADGNLIVCEQGDMLHDACISRVDPRTGERTVLTDRWRGLRFNSPNDVTVGADGLAWFTDPSYGTLQGFRPHAESGDLVYRLDPRTGAIDAVADGFDKPNGIVVSPDGSTLYVTDSGANHERDTFDPGRPHHVVAFDITDRHRLVHRRVVAVIAPGIPDGLKTDAGGRLYVSTANGIVVLEPDGELVGEIVLPGAVNFTFGGRENNVLYITTDNALWAVELAVTGPRQCSAIPLTTGV